MTIYKRSELNKLTLTGITKLYNNFAKYCKVELVKKFCTKSDAINGVMRIQELAAKTEWENSLENYNMKAIDEEHRPTEPCWCCDVVDKQK